ncbi:MAG: hypothetical protein HC850_18655, partial [Rhodomicrobium sp.]|nr:hypothetical protein [Rhodomicrobium sp.]
MLTELEVDRRRNAPDARLVDEAGQIVEVDRALDVLGVENVAGEERDIDLAVVEKIAEARAALDRLIDKADILITNYPFPVRARLRIGYEEVSARNPRLIYASFSGYGEEGGDKDQ